ncbi:MAG: FAD-dependent oxidoreductase, partial [Deltaproteobacteria bacterium]|nr:FAD-dependent oxidoreductase [Deltaproteobacteria bacterium]
HPVRARRQIAVVGAGPAGLACALTAAQRGHAVTLFDAAEAIGGQLNLARRVPGKAEFFELIRYYDEMLRKEGVRLDLGHAVDAAALVAGAYDHVVLATGVIPRRLEIGGIDHPKVCGYADVLSGRVEIGGRVAIIGAGGIGFDVADLLTHPDDAPSFEATWGIDVAYHGASALCASETGEIPREVTLCQRSPGKLGASLGKTTGWIHRETMKRRGVSMLADCRYERVDDRGLILDVGGTSRILEVDHVVVCAGQVSRQELVAPLRARGVTPQLIGGAKIASGLDAKRAIAEGTRLGTDLA